VRSFALAPSPAALRGLRCCTPHAIFPHTTRPLIPAQAQASRRAPPDRDGGDAAPPVPGLARKQKKKNKSKKGRGLGWWWRRV